MRPMLLAIAFLPPCFGPDVVEVAYPYCEDTVTPWDPHEATPLGFKAEDLVYLADGDHEYTLQWARGGDTNVVVGIDSIGAEARFVHSEAVYPDSGGATPAIGIECSDRVEIDARLTFTTADGQFDEAWDIALQGTTADAATFHVDLDVDALTGSYDMSADISEPSYDDRSAWIDGNFTTAGSGGVVEGQVSGEEDCMGGDDCTAWAAQVPIATWTNSGAAE